MKFPGNIFPPSLFLSRDFLIGDCLNFASGIPVEGEQHLERTWMQGWLTDDQLCLGAESRRRPDEFSARSEISSRVAGRQTWFCSEGTRVPCLPPETQAARASNNRSGRQVPENRRKFRDSSCSPQPSLPSAQILAATLDLCVAGWYWQN
jgi:hypothetical protein